MKKIILFSAVVCAALLFANSFIHAEKLKVKPEVFLPTTQKSQSVAVQLRSVQAGLSDISGAKNIGLPVLSPEEISSIEPASKMRPIQIGVNRSLPTNLADKINLTELDWKNVIDGKVAHIIITSSRAVSLRINLSVDAIPDGVELRFFSPTALQQTYTVFTANNIRSKSDDFWSPSVKGEQIGMEIYLPDNTELDDVKISIPEISHIFQDINEPLSKSSIPALRGASASCNIDVACAAQDWQESAKSVAKYIYSVPNNGSFLCTGTLLADSDNSTQIPYFLTANHCINDSGVAESMEFYWFYRAQECGGTVTSPNYQITQGGGELLANSASLDFSFVKLITPPPAGVGLSGWSLDALQQNDEVVGLHHPNGDIKKYSRGQFNTFESIVDNGGGFLTVTPDDNGDFISVIWSEGITAGGSSGSGLWRKENNINYLVGALFGGSSFCSAPQAPDDYSRFDRTYPSIRQWLNPLPTQPDQVDVNITSVGNSATGLKDGVLIARYIQGLRGSALVEGVAESENSEVLEAKLEALHSYLDIDLDGSVTADYDAMLIIRYMLGFQGSALTEGLLASGATRTSPTDIKQYLDVFLQTS